jgi:hypothetical protein
MTSTVIPCDHCRTPVSKSERTVIRFGRDPFDLCRGYCEWYKGLLNLAPAHMAVALPVIRLEPASMKHRPTVLLAEAIAA